MASRVVEVETKPASKSMTLWVNGISFAVFMLGLVTGPELLVTLGVPADWAPRVYIWCGALLAAGNWWLRRNKTGAPIEGSPPAERATKVTRVRAGDL